MSLQHAIQARAYAIWEAEGRPEGRSLVHWLRAEEELMREVAVTDNGKLVESAPPRRRRTRGGERA